MSVQKPILGNLVLQGSLIALKIIQQYIANPSIAGVAIECESYTETFEAEVSQQIIITPISGLGATGTGKQYISDNIAPKPRTFTLKGYIAPSLLDLTGLSPLLQPILNLRINILRKAFNSRQLLVFTTKNHEEILRVAIASMQLDSVPDVQNRQPIALTIREVPVLNVVSIGTNATPIDIQNASSVASATLTASAIPFTDGLATLL